MRISPARVAAFDILSRIETDGAFSSVLLPAHEADLPPIDRGLCHELVMGVLRHQIYLDRLIDHVAGNKRLDTSVRLALRLGLYQLVYLDKVPAYSAINESVNLVQRAKKTSAKGLVNAVLRKLATGLPQLEFKDDVERVTVETSHPRWLIEKWASEFGHDGAEQIALANNKVPRSAFRITANGAKALSTIADKSELSEFVEGCFFAEASGAVLREAADAGLVYFQDEASQMVAQVVTNGVGMRILDVCAAPGGKTGLIAANVGKAFIVAGDLHRARVDLLHANCERQGVDGVRVVQYDAAESLPFANDTFDTVLVDAPCSGTGTIRHNPEIRYFLAETDFSALASKQLAILRNASKVVAPNGRLVYSTCSLQFEENEAVCRGFLAETTGFSQTTPDVAARFITEDGFARTFPHRDHMDGFFIAEFQRIQ